MHSHLPVGDLEVQQSVWEQTLKEVDDGALVGPTNLADIPQQRPKARCVDDFIGSGVNACAQVVERPQPHTLDTIAGLCVPLMSGSSSKEHWKVRFFDLKGAYRQCAVNPSPSPFAHIAVFDPTTNKTFACMVKALPFGA